MNATMMWPSGYCLTCFWFSLPAAHRLLPSLLIPRAGEALDQDRHRRLCRYCQLRPRPRGRPGPRLAPRRSPGAAAGRGGKDVRPTEFDVLIQI